ncbi:MAG: tyrosine-protein phosphatase [Clostridia bacterium]|nr:tyrosine-protein phosphatase [Clostridia bacterium]
MIRNIRDFSVYVNKDGKKLRANQFYRSAALISLKDKDISFLNSIRPLTVIDLRSETEINEKPDYKLDKYIHVPILPEDSPGVSHSNDADNRMAKDVPNMIELYSDFIRDDYCVNGLGTALNAICDLDREGSILWHCSEGKDRCGLVSALFLKLLDYDDEVILTDYLKSRKSANRKAYKYYWLVLFMRKDRVLANAVKEAFFVKKEYLQAALDQIINRFGSYEAFYEYIGLSQDKIIKIKEKFLE